MRLVQLVSRDVLVWVGPSSLPLRSVRVAIPGDRKSRVPIESWRGRRCDTGHDNLGNHANSRSGDRGSSKVTSSSSVSQRESNGKDGLGVLTGQRSERAACGGMRRRSTGRRHDLITGLWSVESGRKMEVQTAGIRENANTTDGCG